MPRRQCGLRMYLVVLTALAIGAVACSLGGGSAPQALSPTQPAPATPSGSTVQPPAPPSGDAREALLAAFRGLDTAYPFRLTEDTTSGGPGGTATFHRVAEFQSKDLWHSVWTGAPMPGDTTEAIYINGDFYLARNGEWKTGGSEQSPMTAVDFIEPYLVDVQLGPLEDVAGVPAWRYDFSLEGIASGTGQAWVGAEDGLVHRVDAQGQINMGGTILPVTTSLLYEFGLSFDIQPPP